MLTSMRTASCWCCCYSSETLWTSWCRQIDVTTPWKSCQACRALSDTGKGYEGIIFWMRISPLPLQIPPPCISGEVLVLDILLSEECQLLDAIELALEAR